MKIALLNQIELTDFNIEAWRFFKDAGLECQIFTENPIGDYIIECKVGYPKINQVGHTRYGETFQQVRLPDQSHSGVETIHDNEVLAKAMHYNVIKSMTEPNPLWSEHKKNINEFTKPKDQGMKRVEGSHLIVVLYNAYNKKDCDRFQRNMRKCSQSLVHGFCQFMLLSK